MFAFRCFFPPSFRGLRASRPYEPIPPVAADGRVVSNEESANLRVVFHEELANVGVVPYGNPQPGSCSLFDVYEGQYKGKAVYFKRVRTWSIPRHETPARLKRLADDAVRLREGYHPNVLPILEIVSDVSKPQLCFIVPALNLTIRQYLTDQQDLNIYPLVLQIASGLAWLHDQDLVHGDIRGDNLLIDNKGQVKLTNVGTSVYRDKTEKRIWRWWAPELLSAGVYTRPTDSFALAMTMLELYTLRDPFYAEPNEFKIGMAVSNGARPLRPSTQSDADFEEFWRLINELWKQEPGDRLSVRDAELCMATIAYSKKQ